MKTLGTKERASGSGPKAPVRREVLAQAFETLLEPGRFRDYCPNGLQVEGRAGVRRLASGVTASQAMLRAAIAWGADAVVVHHGWFWRGEDAVLTGLRRQRVGLLLAADLNLFAYHLPLDAHPEVGNNACLGRVLGWQVDHQVGEQGLVCLHRLPQAVTPQALGAQLSQGLGREPLQVGERRRRVRTIAWCTGAAQDMIEIAAAAGADAFVSGEISERTTHLARELGLAYYAAGHHATERFGVQALAARVSDSLGLEHRFFDDPNPV